MTITSDNDLQSYPPFFRPNSPESGQDPPPEADPEPASLPEIDLEEMKGEKVGEACREWGMFRLTNHGVPAKLLSQLHQHATKLFSLTFESKQAFPTSPILYFWGSPALTMSGNAKQTGPVTHRLNWLEGFNVPLTMVSSYQHHHPLLQSFRSLLEEYGTHQTRLAKAIFTTMAQHLNLPPSTLESYLSPATGVLRVYRYLRCQVAAERWGIGPHTDSSVLSIIHQDQVGGLQVYKNNQWLDVKPIHDTLIVNLGDMMQAMSDDVFVSVTHRVRVKRERERISIGYFVFPKEDAVIESSKYRPFTYADFQAEKELDLKTVGEKIGLPRFKKK